MQTPGRAWAHLSTLTTMPSSGSFAPCRLHQPVFQADILLTLCPLLPRLRWWWLLISFFISKCLFQKAASWALQASVLLAPFFFSTFFSAGTFSLEVVPPLTLSLCLNAIFSGRYLLYSLTKNCVPFICPSPSLPGVPTLTTAPFLFSLTTALVPGAERFVFSCSLLSGRVGST